MTDHRPALLKYVLPLVPFDGWTAYTLRMAAKKAGLTENEITKAFPGGADDCVDYFFAQADEALIEIFSDGSLTKLRVPERIEKLVLTKLERWQPHREAVRRAIAKRALPWNMFKAQALLYHSVDILWRLAGDTSTDFNFYTKRATLAAVLSSTLLFWLNDHSGNMDNTQEFLERRLSDVAAFGKWKKEITAKFSAQ